MTNRPKPIGEPLVILSHALTHCMTLPDGQARDEIYQALCVACEVIREQRKQLEGLEG